MQCPLIVATSGGNRPRLDEPVQANLTVGLRCGGPLDDLRETMLDVKPGQNAR